MPPLVSIAVTPARRIRGRLTVPGDKSISHRYAILAALAEGRSELSNYAPGADCHSTLACIGRLGVDVTAGPSGSVMIVGRGLGRLRSANGPLDAGNSGTTMRLMAGVLAAHPFASTLVGDASLSRRPMRRVIAPLTAMGATFEAVDGHAPLTIRGGPLRAIDFRPDTPSAQVKSAVLLAGLHAAGTTRVTEPTATRDHTERALAEFGGRADVRGGTVSVAGGQTLHGQRLVVPGDFSSAAFWLVAAAMRPGSEVTIEDVGLNPTRTALLDVLRRYGARVEIDTQSTAGGEARGAITVAASDARPIAIAASDVPGLIDELPAVAALAAGGVDVVVRGAAELRVKESDRIATLVRGFRALGFDADEAPDGFAIRGTRRLAGGVADAAGDHRMAMAFAIAALAADRPSTIDGADAVAISYPSFFDTLPRLAQ